MHIGIYTPDPHLLGEQAAAVEELIETSCLNLSLHLYSRHGDLIASLTNQPLDVLFYHIEAGGEFENRVWEVRRIRAVPGCWWATPPGTPSSVTRCGRRTSSSPPWTRRT